MTIAAGILCTDGVVLGADTEYTGAIKQHGAKVWDIRPDGAASVACGMAGAGDGIFLRWVRDKIVSASELEPMKTRGEAISVIEDQLAKLFQKHVFPNPTLGDPNTALRLIIGVRDKESIGLYETSGTAVAETDRYVCVGYGADLASYLMETLMATLLKKKFNTSMGNALMAYVLRQTKKYSLYCGGPSSILTMQQNGDTWYVSPTDIEVMEKTFSEMEGVPYAAIPQAAAQVFIQAHAARLEKEKSETEARLKADSPVPQDPKRGRKRRPPSRG